MDQNPNDHIYASADVRENAIKNVEGLTEILFEQHNAKVAAIIQSPNPNQHVVFAKPSVDEVLDAFGFEFSVTDPLQRFLHYLELATLKLKQCIPDELDELEELLEIVEAKLQTP